MSLSTRRGEQIDNTCAVFIEYEQDDRGNFRIATVGEDDWDERAFVVGAERCDEHSKCNLITVIAPGTITAREEVHALTDTLYAVEAG